MEYDWQFSRKIKCSDDEKRDCMKLISDLINMSIMARRNGLLSLVQLAEESSFFLLNKGLQLVVDGVTPQVVRNVLESYILSGGLEGKALLERIDYVLHELRRPVLIEEFIDGDEVTVGIIGNNPAKIAGIMRVVPRKCE